MRPPAFFARLTLAAMLAALPWATPTAAAAAAPPGTTCSVFPTDNVWNTDISTLPVNSHSAAWLASTGATSGRLLHPDFGGPPYGIPFNVVTNAHATANFNFLYWDESDPPVSTRQAQGPYPYGSDLKVEGPTDSHLLTINSDTCTLYEIGGTDYNGAHTGWSGAIFDLSSNALRPNTWTSADAAGLPIFPGLVRLDEVQAGAINHAIRFTVQQSDTTYLWPARHQAGSASNHNLPPMGARFRLKANYNISGFNAQAQVVLTAMKHYGVIVADNGSNWYFQGTMDAGWDNEPYATMVSQLKTVPASAFEAVDESSLMVDPNSGQALPPTPCTAASITPTPGSFAAGSTIAFNVTATGCASPRYEFWVRPAGGTWTLARIYGTSSSFNWNTTGLNAGTYEVAAWARDSRSGLRYEVATGGNYTLTGCTSPSISPAPGPYAGGSTLNLTVSVSNCTSPEFAFWVRPAGGTWAQVRSYSSSPSFSWKTSGLAPGTYELAAWVRRQGTTARYEVATGGSYVLSGCTSATISPPPGGFTAGSTIGFTVSAGGCAAPEVAYWIRPAGGLWKVVRGYSTTLTYNWNTAGLARGTYEVAARVREHGSTKAYEVAAGGSYTLS